MALHTRIASLIGILAAGIVLIALPTTGLADDPATLHAQAARLQTAAQTARLELFALESRLDTARAALRSVETRLAAVERERVASRRQLRAARRTLTLSEQRLADQVRALYVQDQPDLLAVFLGAASIEDALDNVDNLQRAADATNGVLGEAKVGRVRVVRLLESLRTRRNSLRELRAAAVTRTIDLEQAQASRLAYLAKLRAEQVLNDQQIAAAASAAQAASSAASFETVTAQATPSISSIGAQTVASEPTPPPQPSPTPQAPVATSGRTLSVIVTAYTIRGTTATGIPTGPGVVAVDPSVIPLGTRMTIPGYGEGVAADTGGAIRGLRIDVWVRTAAEAAKWQWQTVRITLH